MLRPRLRYQQIIVMQFKGALACGTQYPTVYEIDCMLYSCKSTTHVSMLE